jgi:carboxymethylenebutenolidase
MGSTVVFNRPDGQTVNGYLAEPAHAYGAPGIVVIQEWWGLNDQIRGVADGLAAKGYRALVPDLYRGKSTVEAEEAHHLMTSLDFADAAQQDVAGAIQHLKDTGTPNVGVTGFCMGGALTLLTLVFVPAADAGVVWYGYPPLELVDAKEITVPLMGHFATEDVPFPIAGVDALEDKLKAAGVPYTFHRYAAQHAFANETQVEGRKLLPVLGYDPAAAALAWERTHAFFEQHLK